ncbi:Protein of unknown function [Pyronema omphalodes CBS 100304]|uniref:Uncharacterized protein n=1 Tax=Pyronema omphalodes (strain CBS 100304) TaxID=1076935 RepID=U4LTQ2_PYROM|nr:Protein of unknown function [Pyronema omphalodes CBS 100304]
MQLKARTAPQLSHLPPPRFHRRSSSTSTPFNANAIFRLLQLYIHATSYTRSTRLE